ncbi:1815_t:CDS:1 [Acaulospora morrowiae]|uniref:1815_t:CDS:1 n=1 Tax=Acaulospora morrowiae TaxID=94023 RepID=A0A9N8ZJB9_9GLOM|nr:1815_t:CDS:1 [Acaulospora morrowiae]
MTRQAISKSAQRNTLTTTRRDISANSSRVNHTQIIRQNVTPPDSPIAQQENQFGSRSPDMRDDEILQHIQDNFQHCTISEDSFRENLKESQRAQIDDHPYITPPVTPKDDNQNSPILFKQNAVTDLSRYDIPIPRDIVFAQWNIKQDSSIDFSGERRFSNKFKEMFQSRIPYGCFKKVLDYLEDSSSALYSLLLVNRSVCRLVIPRLWRRPFHHTVNKPPKFGAILIQTYVSFLSDNEIARLLDAGVHLRNVRKSTLDYTRHLKDFDSHMVERAVKDWITIMNPRHPDSIPKFQVTNLVISNMIFRHSGGLENLSISPDYIEEKVFIDISLFIGARDALSKITKFELDIHVRCASSNEGVSKLVSMMSQYTHNLQHISIKIGYLDEPHIIIQSLSKLIRSQKKLRSLAIENNWDPSVISLMDPSICSQANSLTHLTYEGLLIPEKFLQLLEACKNLETLEFNGYYNPRKYSFVDHGITSTRFNFSTLKCKADLSSVNPFNSTRSDTLGIILQMVNKNLRSLILGGATVELMDIISTHCTNVTTLYIKGPNLRAPILERMLNRLVKLETLDLGDIHDDITYISHVDSATVKFVAESIPTSVKYFGFHFSMTTEGLRLFLEKCNARLVKIGLFRDRLIKDESIEVLTEYAMKGGYLKKIVYYPEVWKRDGQQSDGFSEEVLEKAWKWIPNIVRETCSETRIHGKIFFYLFRLSIYLGGIFFH